MLPVLQILGRIRRDIQHFLERRSPWQPLENLRKRLGTPID
jgi:hypothetical protein